MDNTVITIGRQFGSGGSDVGKLLAGELKIAYYDKELLQVAAAESGLNQQIFEKADEKEPARLAFAFHSTGCCGLHEDFLSNERLFMMQCDAIRLIAERESCVIIGRCSDYVLRDFPRHLSVFIHDTPENRVDRITKKLNIGAQAARDMMDRIDRVRASYYNYFTDKCWGKAESYNLSIDVSILGTEATAVFLKDLIARTF
ncbi:MAG: cytidylate kinase-like family protein [Prevotellaceae bacterium]|nr:cytidylate kinase-like family protein [Prevotellaceae bacterium]